MASVPRYRPEFNISVCLTFCLFTKWNIYFKWPSVDDFQSPSISVAALKACSLTWSSTVNRKRIQTAYITSIQFLWAHFYLGLCVTLPNVRCCTSHAVNNSSTKVSAEVLMYADTSFAWWPKKTADTHAQCTPRTHVLHQKKTSDTNRKIVVLLR